MAEQNINFPLAMVSVPSLSSDRPCSANTTSSNGISAFAFNRFLQQTGMILLVTLLSLGSYYVVSHYVLKSVRVVGVSMMPTLPENSKYLLKLWEVHYRAPHHGEIVVLRDPQDHELAIKRVIAVGGESVHFKDGKVFVDGVELKESYLQPHMRTFTYARAREQFITCGKDQYFVLGDNRENSIDSRVYGPVSRSEVLGLVSVP